MKSRDDHKNTRKNREEERNLTEGQWEDERIPFLPWYWELQRFDFGFQWSDSWLIHHRLPLHSSPRHNLGHVPERGTNRMREEVMKRREGEGVPLRDPQWIVRTWGVRSHQGVGQWRDDGWIWSFSLRWQKTLAKSNEGLRKVHKWCFGNSLHHSPEWRNFRITQWGQQVRTEENQQPKADGNPFFTKRVNEIFANKN